jgi:hypothetical protein
MALPAEGLRVVLDPIPGLTMKGLLPASGFRFMCPPLEEFSQEYGHSHTDYDTLTYQHSRKGVPQLATFSFDTLAVDAGETEDGRLMPTWLTDATPMDVEDVTLTLRKLVNHGTPFLLTVAHDLPPRGYDNWSLTQVGPEVQLPCTLRTLKVTEKAGEGDARYYSLAFTQYRREEVSTAKKKGKGARGSKIKFPTHAYIYWDGRAIDADGSKIADPPASPLTLARLSRHFYKDATGAKAIAKANAIKGWGANDALIKLPKYKKLKKGQRAKITIPKTVLVTQVENIGPLVGTVKLG